MRVSVPYCVLAYGNVFKVSQEGGRIDVNEGKSEFSQRSLSLSLSLSLPVAPSLAPFGRYRPRQAEKPKHHKELAWHFSSKRKEKWEELQKKITKSFSNVKILSRTRKK